MSRVPGVLFALLLASAAFAQNFDLQASIDAPDSVRGGETFTFRGTVRNAGPDASPDFKLFFGASYPRCHEGVQIGGLAAGESRTFECSVTPPAPPYAVFVTLIAAAPGDRDPGNNNLDKRVTIVTPPDLLVSYPTSSLTYPALPFRQIASYYNIAATTATGVKVTVTGPQILKAPENCVVTGNVAVCDVGELASGKVGAIAIDFLAPDASEQTFDVTIEISGNEADPDPSSNRIVAKSRTYRTFFVTNTSESGSGSLRAAIEGANGCNSVYPCAIAFRIPPSGAAWQTIHVTTPLPRVTAAQVQLDATTQRAYFGDTNPLGPEIEISGSETAGNGIEMSVPCEASVRGLAINGFSGAGLLFGSTVACVTAPRSVADNYIGTDPTGMRAVPNGRGIEIDTGEQQIPWSITRNLISGNRRSGIFIASGPRTKIFQNIIGLNATVTAGLGNGASGIYISTAGQASDVNDNYIGFNGHWGVAVAALTLNVALSGNSFQANGLQAIDYELDGLVSNAPIPIPEITSARFENGVTIVEGFAKTGGTFATRLSVYANDEPDPSGYGEGQYYLGTAYAESSGHFTFRYDGDLRGKWIAATETQQRYFGFAGVQPQGDEHLLFTTTSEFSRTIEVR